MGNLQDDVGYGDLKKKFERLEAGKGPLPAPLPTGTRTGIAQSIA